MITSEFSESLRAIELFFREHGWYEIETWRERSLGYSAKVKKSGYLYVMHVHVDDDLGLETWVSVPHLEGKLIFEGHLSDPSCFKKLSVELDKL